MSEQPSQTKEENQGAVGKMLTVIAYPFSLLVGGFFAHAHVRDTSYDALKKVNNGRNKPGGAFFREYEVRDSTVQQLLAAFERKEISGEEFARARHTADIAYSKAADKTLGELGYPSIWKRFGHLEWNQKLQTTITFATAAGITLGVILTLANGKELLDRLKNIGHKRDDQASNDKKAIDSTSALS